MVALNAADDIIDAAETTAARESPGRAWPVVAEGEAEELFQRLALMACGERRHNLCADTIANAAARDEA